MPRILVDPEELEQLAGTLRRCVGQMRAVGHRLDRTVGSLDWESSHRIGLLDRGATARHRADALGDELERLARFIAAKAQAFAEADRPAESVPYLRTFLTWSMRYASRLPGSGLFGMNPQSMERLIDLGLLDLDPRHPADLMRLFPRTGVNPVVAEALRSWAHQLGPFNGLEAQRSELDPLIGLAGLIGLAPRPHWVIGRRGQVDGLTYHRVEVAGPSLYGTSAQYDLAHYEKNLLNDRVTLQAGAGHLEGNLQVFEPMTGEFNLKVSAEVSALHGEAEAVLAGNEAVQVAATAEGDVAGASAELSLGRDGFGAELSAHLVQGEAALELKLFSWKAVLGVQGCAVCAGVGAKVGSEGHLGLAAGLGGRIFWEFEPADAPVEPAG